MGSAGASHQVEWRRSIRRGVEVFYRCLKAGEASVALCRATGLGFSIRKLIHSFNGCMFKSAGIFGTWHKICAQDVSVTSHPRGARDNCPSAAEKLAVKHLES